MSSLGLSHLSLTFSTLTSYPAFCWLLPTAKWSLYDQACKKSRFMGLSNEYGEGNLSTWSFRIITITGAYVLCSYEVLILITASMKCPVVEQASNATREQVAAPSLPCHYYISGHSLPDRLILQHSGSSIGRDHWCLLSPNSFHSIFWCCERWPARRKLPSGIEPRIPPCPAAKMSFPVSFGSCTFSRQQFAFKLGVSMC